MYGPCQGIHGVPSIPGHRQSCSYQWASTSAGYIRSSTSSCRWVVINNSSFIPGRQQSIVYTRSSAIPCSYQGETIHTSGRGVGSASSAGKLQRSDSWAVCVVGAWASAIHTDGTILDSVFPHSTRLRDVQYSGRPFRTAQGSSFSLGSVYIQPRVRTSGMGQRKYQTWPGASSEPRFLYRISRVLFV